MNDFRALDASITSQMDSDHISLKKLNKSVMRDALNSTFGYQASTQNSSGEANESIVKARSFFKSFEKFTKNNLSQLLDVQNMLENSSDIVRKSVDIIARVAQSTVNYSSKGDQIPNETLEFFDEKLLDLKSNVDGSLNSTLFNAVQLDEKSLKYFKLRSDKREKIFFDDLYSKYNIFSEYRSVSKNAIKIKFDQNQK